jgi:hypothetical protein
VPSSKFGSSPRGLDLWDSGLTLLPEIFGVTIRRFPTHTTPHIPLRIILQALARQDRSLNHSSSALYSLTEAHYASPVWELIILPHIVSYSIVIRVLYSLERVCQPYSPSFSKYRLRDSNPRPSD